MRTLALLSLALAGCLSAPADRLSGGPVDVPAPVPDGQRLTAPGSPEAGRPAVPDPCCGYDVPESCLPPPGECWEYTCGRGFCSPQG